MLRTMRITSKLRVPLSLLKTLIALTKYTFIQIVKEDTKFLNFSW